MKLDEKKSTEIIKTRHGDSRANTGGMRSGAGRKKGAPNKLTRDLKTMIEQALQNKGGVKYFERVAEENMTAFCTLIGKALPMTIAGDPDNPIHHVAEIRFTVRDPRH